MTLKIDTGAQANLLPRSLFAKLGCATKICPSKVLPTGYEGNVIEHVGTTSLPISIGDKGMPANSFIVKKDKQALLGLPTCERLSLVSHTHAISSQPSLKEQIAVEFPDLLKSLGCVSCRYSIKLKETARRVAVPVRLVSHARTASLREVLNTWKLRAS